MKIPFEEGFICKVVHKVSRANNSFIIRYCNRTLPSLHFVDDKIAGLYIFILRSIF